MARQQFERKNSEAARAAIALIIEREISDPRVDLTTVTGVEVSPDKSYANVYVSNDPERYDQVLAGLESAKGRIRTILGQALGWRTTPELRFFIDDSIDEGQRVADILAEAEARRAAFKAEESDA